MSIHFKIIVGRLEIHVPSQFEVTELGAKKRSGGGLQDLAIQPFIRELVIRKSAKRLGIEWTEICKPLKW